METVYSKYVLQNEAPQRSYRWIVAKNEESPFHLQFFVEIREGRSLETGLSEDENAVVNVVPCATRSEAMSLAEEEHRSSLRNGWRDYEEGV
jgi:hypothetical protein